MPKWSMLVISDANIMTFIDIWSIIVKYLTIFKDVTSRKNYGKT